MEKHHNPIKKGVDKPISLFNYPVNRSSSYQDLWLFF